MASHPILYITCDCEGVLGVASRPILYITCEGVLGVAYHTIPLPVRVLGVASHPILCITCEGF